MNSDCDAVVTPRPVYHHDGRKSPDCYAWPAALKDELLRRHGAFPLFRFWGPGADIRSTRWIADSLATAWDAVQPDLGLVYLPHLDYDLQRHGPQGGHLARNLREVDAAVATVADHARSRGAAVLVVSEYGLAAVDRAIFPNRLLRQAGLLTAVRNAAGELIDTGASRAFAVVDHQLAHVYVRDAADVPRVEACLRADPGVAGTWAGGVRRELGLDHPRSGEVVALAAPGAWFAHEWWLDEAAAPDFARCVEIHKKPGYDPRELLLDPQGGRWRLGRALLRKMLGLRYLMDVIPADPRLVKGSHGRPPARPEDGAVIIGSDAAWRREAWSMTDIAGLIEAHFA